MENQNKTAKKVVPKIKSYWLSDVSFVSQMFFLLFMVFLVPILNDLGFFYPTVWHGLFLLFLLSGLFYEFQNHLLFIAITLLVMQVVLFGFELWSDKIDSFFFHWITLLNLVFFIYLNIRLVFRDKSVNFFRIVGAVNIYLLIAFYGALTTGYLHDLMGASVEGNIQLTNTEADYGNFMYFSLTSMTTVGFGDIYPLTMPIKMLSVFLSGIGILFPAIVLARLVGLYSGK